MHSSGPQYCLTFCSRKYTRPSLRDFRPEQDLDSRGNGHRHSTNFKRQLWRRPLASILSYKRVFIIVVETFWKSWCTCSYKLLYSCKSVPKPFVFVALLQFVYRKIKHPVYRFHCELVSQKSIFNYIICRV